MASRTSFFVSIVLLLQTFQALSTTPYSPYSETAPHPYCDRPCQTEANLHLYLHQFVAGENRPNRNEEFVLTPGFNNGFGTTLIHDWTITATTNPNDIIVARAQGTHIQAGRTNGSSWYISMNIVFESGRFAGSTLQVMGILTAQIEGQWSVMGGTGQFTMARGTVNFRMDIPSSTAENGIRELDIHLIYTSNTPQANQMGTGPVGKLLGGNCHVIDSCCCKP